MSSRHREVNGSGPEPMKAKFGVEEVEQGRNAERVEHSMRERSR